MRSLAHLLGLGLISALALSLTACGDDDGTTGTTTTGSMTTSATGATSTVSDDGNSNHSNGSTSGSNPSGDSTSVPDSSSTDPSSSGDGSSGETSGSTDSTGGNPSTIADKLVDAACTWAGNCCDNGEFDEILGPHVTDVADCAVRLKEQLHQNDDNAESDRLAFVGGVLSDLAYTIDLNASDAVQAAVDACFEVLSNRGCNELTRDGRCEAPSDDPCALNKLFVGKLPSGAQCDGKLRGPFRDVECVYGTSCEDTEDSDEDVFKCVTKGTLDAPCEPESQFDDGSCEFDLYCDGATGTCKPRPGLGEACSYIDPSSPHVTNLTALYATDPDLADIHRGNEKIPCEAGLTCDPVAKACVLDCSAGDVCGAPAEDGFVAAGGAGDKECPAGLGCQPVQFPNHIGAYYYTCGAPRSAEGLCDTDADCKNGHHCNGVQPAGEGDDQDTKIDGAPGKGVCKPDHAEGTFCERDSECSDGNYCKPCSAFGDGEAPAGCYAEGDDDDDDDEGEARRVLGAFDPNRGACADFEQFDEPCVKDIGCGPQALGCLWSDHNSKDEAVPYGRYCMANTLPIGARCELHDGLNDDAVNYVNSGNYEKIKAPVYKGEGEDDLYAPWMDYCQAPTAMCADPDQDGAWTCVHGAQLNQPCDHNPETEAKQLCGPGLHCVNAACVPFLQTGSTCDPATNNAKNWNAVEYRNNGFTKPMCDPDTSVCDKVYGSYYCSPLDVDTTRRIWCDGGAGTPG